MAHADITVLPLGTGSTSLSAHIAEIQRVLAAQSNVGYTLHAMGTTLEGDPAELFPLIAKLHEVPFQHGAERSYLVVKLDDRRDGRAQSLADKVDSVKRRLR